MIRPGRMTCREFVDFMMDYLSNEMAGDTRATFERHLTAFCPFAVATPFTSSTFCLPS